MGKIMMKSPMQPKEIKFVFGFHGKEITNE